MAGMSQEEFVSYIKSSPERTEAYSNKSDDEKLSIYNKFVGGAQEEQAEVESPDFTPGYGRVKEIQQERPNVYAPIGQAAEKFKGGEVPGLINVRSDEYFKNKGVSPAGAAQISPDLKENMMLGASLAAIPYRAVESPIALAAVEAQAGNFKGIPGAFMKGVLDQEVGEYGDLIRTMAKKESLSNEFLAGSFGLLTSIGLGTEMFSGLGKRAARFGGLNYVKKQVKEGGKIVDLVGQKIHARLDDFYAKNNVNFTEGGVEALTKFVGSLPKKLQSAIGKAPRNLREAWKSKIAVGKEMQSVWRKEVRDVPLTGADELLKDAYFSMDDVIVGSLKNTRDKVMYKAMNKEASQQIVDNGIVRAMLKDKSGRYADTDVLKGAFMGAKDMPKTYLERVGNMEKSMKGVITNMEKYANWHKVGKWVKGTAGYAGHALLVSKLLGKNIANKTGD